MTHQRYRKQLHLLLYNELEPSEEQALREHLRTCKECRAELEKLQELHNMLAPGRIQVDDTLLHEARTQLREALRREHVRTSLWERLQDFVFSSTGSGYRLALGGAAAIVLGVTIGRLSVTTQGAKEQEMPQPLAATAVPVEGNTRITNVRFISSGDGHGEIEFTFEAVTPVHMRGSVDDPRIQKVLTHAMLNEENPGVRIRAVNAIGEQKVEPADQKVKNALILALQRDENAAVRKEALTALRKFPFDADVKNALLHTLMNDKNPGLRIAAINGLDSAGTVARHGQDVLNVLRNRADSDDNNYIRLRAKAALQEVQLQ